MKAEMHVCCDDLDYDLDYKGIDMADDMQVKREIVLEADAETIERMRKEGHARGFTVYCDEGERIGGDNSAPPPLAYFGLAVGF
jgi:hypothetical protein